MKNDVQKMNQGALGLSPADFSKAAPEEVELCHFSIPDFSDAVQVNFEAAEDVGELPPSIEPEHPCGAGNTGLKLREIQPEITEPPESKTDEPSDPLPAIPPPLAATETIQVGIQQRISELRVTCDPLVKCITGRIEPGSFGLYLICDVDTPLRSGQACLVIARELAIATGQKVLVIDSDLETASLSRRLGQEQRPGTREMLRAMNGWQRLVMPTDVENVQFLPCGTQKLRFTEPSSFVESVIRKALGEMSEEFVAVLVTTGSAFDNSVHAWRGLCTGTFLVLDSDLTSRSIAQAAVRELNAGGCRVLGCLPTYQQVKTGGPRPKNQPGSFFAQRQTAGNGSGQQQS